MVANHSKGRKLTEKLPVLVTGGAGYIGSHAVLALLDQVETRLPEQARDLFKQSRDAAKDARGQVRSLVNRTAA